MHNETLRYERRDMQTLRLGFRALSEYESEIDFEDLLCAACCGVIQFFPPYLTVTVLIH